MKHLIQLLLIALMSCQSSQNSTFGPEQTVLAYINDTSIYADGCELYIEQERDSLTVPALQYKPSVATLYTVKRAQLAISPGQPMPTRIPVSIRFKKTGKQVVIHCGWVSPTVAEIDVLDVTKR